MLYTQSLTSLNPASPAPPPRPPTPANASQPQPPHAAHRALPRLPAMDNTRPPLHAANFPVPEEHKAALLPQLKAKPVRTASGIAVVAVMSKPHRCPHIATTGAALGVDWGAAGLLRAARPAPLVDHGTPIPPPPGRRAGNICVYCPGGPDSDFEYSTQVGCGVI